ncbi:MAG: aldose epimerase family protein [Bacteroidota bacterium]
MLDPTQFDTVLNNKKVALFELKNNKCKAFFTNYGARIVSLNVPDKKGIMTDVVLGFGSIKQFITAGGFYGSAIGRFGNRIAKGTFVIDGQTYHLPLNNGVNTLHGGPQGFHSIVWDANRLNDSTLQFSYKSPNGEMGFPGNLDVKITYQLLRGATLKIDYKTTTDKKTVINLTNHTYFNLNGEGSGSVLEHKLQIFADKYTPVDSTLIPTGELASVKNTPFNFLTPKTIGKNIEEENEQLKKGKGYDHNFVLNGKGSAHKAAMVTGDKSGIIMTVITDEPGLQFYSGNFMMGKNKMKNGSTDRLRTAFALETQHFPDSPNQPAFPSTELNPGQVYHSVSVYKFSVIK